jgi:hypothetical protein
LKNTMDAEFTAISNGAAEATTGATGTSGGALDRTLASQRRRMVDAFMQFRGDASGESVLEVGIVPAAGTERAFAPSGLADRTPVTSCAIASPALRRPVSSSAAANRLQQPLDSRHLPFSDGEFDWVYCSEVIEHAGSFERQYELLKELLRISRKGIFITTPNRWHPIEFNTRTALLHWLPMAWWRRLLKWSGKGLWASESVLNLLDSHELKNLTALLPCRPKGEIGHLRVLGVKAHFFLQIRKGSGVKPEKKV